MENLNLTNVNRFLKLEFSGKKDIWLTDTYTLRKLVGILGMLLPLLLWLCLFIASGHPRPLDSISHYYFTRVSGIFVIIVSLMAVFLLIYKGEDTLDFYLSSLAGIFALCLLMFPTGNISDLCCDASRPYSVTRLGKSGLRETYHYVSAGIFLLSLACMSIWIFTRSDLPAAKRKRRKIIRNRIYRTCGVIMIASIALIFAGFLEIIPAGFYDANHLTFWLEAVAVESFGVSWWIKGETLFRDRALTETALPAPGKN